MKKLRIIRHAKSSWKETNQRDFDRPLNKRGKANAPEMGRRFKDRDECPDLIVSSPALRAQTTAQIIAQEIGYDKELILFEDRIYEALTETLVEVLREIDESFSFVYLVGHNPGFLDLANQIAGAGLENLPTCGTVLLDLRDSSWVDVRRGSGTVLEFDFPKNV